MTDPLSVTASVLTLLQATAATCKLVHTLVVHIKETPNDIRSQNEKLYCLHQTILRLIDIYAKLPPEDQSDLPWHEWIATFAGNVAEIKAKIEKTSSAIENGNRVWGTCRWLLFDRQLRRFFESLEHWNIVFSQAIAASQLLDNTTKEIVSKSQYTCAIQRPIPHSIPADETFFVAPTIAPEKWLNIRHESTTDTLTSHSSTDADLIRLPNHQAFQARSAAFTTTNVFWSRDTTLKIIYGPVKEFLTHKNGIHTVKANGYGFNISFHIPLWTPRRLSLRVFGLFQKSTAGLDISVHLKLPRIIRKNSVWYHAARTGDVSMLKRWIQSGQVGVSDVTPRGYTLLHIAALHQQLEVISFLIDCGADVNATNDWAQTPMHITVRHVEDYECTRRLLSAGADILAQDIGGATPLHTYFNPVTDRLLRVCRDQIDISMTDDQGKTVLHHACRTKSSSSNLIHQAINSSSTPFGYSQNASKKDHVDIKDLHGRSILHFAAERGNVAIVGYLFSLPQANSLAKADYSGRTVLHYATQNRRVAALDLAIEFGIDLDSRDRHGQSAMHWAASTSNIEAMKRLLEVGGEQQLKHVDAGGRTPLALAKVYNRKPAIDYLGGLCQSEDSNSAVELSLALSKGGLAVEQKRYDGKFYSEMPALMAYCTLGVVGLGCLFLYCICKYYWS